MNATTELLTELQALGVVLAADGDRLCFHPRDKVTPDLLARLRDCKAELLTMLQPGNSGNGYETPSEPGENGGSVAIASVADSRDPAATPRTRPSDPVPVEWPGAAADFCLLLTADDLPPVPFRLNPWTEVRDAGKMLRRLRANILRGPGGPRAFYGALQSDLEELRGFALAAGEGQFKNSS